VGWPLVADDFTLDERHISKLLPTHFSLND
jgi:hypothetical protein